MIKHSIPSSFSKPGDSFMYPLFNSTNPYCRKEYIMPGLSSVLKLPYSEDSSYQINIPFKQAELGHTAIIKNKILNTTKPDKKGILKVKLAETCESMSGSYKISDNEQTISKRRKHSGNTTEKHKPCAKQTKKKVKFDDKYNRLHAIERKYRVAGDGNSNDEKKQGEDNLDQQRQLQRPTIRNEEETDSTKQSYPEIAEIIELPVPTYDISSGRFQTKSTSSSSGLKDVKTQNTNVSSEAQKERNIFHKDVRIGFDESYEVPIEDLVITNGRCIGMSQDKYLKESRDHKILTKPPKLSFSHKTESCDTKSSRQKHELFKSSKIKQSISGKTVVNTEGGATVTRSRVRPSMFSLLSHEIMPAPLAPRRSYRNFCDEGKTDLIVRWIQDVSSVQAKEGFCTLLHTDDVLEKRNDC